MPGSEYDGYNTGSFRTGSVSDPRAAAELRCFREDSGLPGEVVAKAMRWSPSKISRIERGVSAMSRHTLGRILDYYVSKGMDRSRADAIRAMQEQAFAMFRYQHPLLGPAVMASAVLEWAPLYVPRLLQVPEYAKAVLTDMALVTQTPPGEVREIAAAIGRWQELLQDGPVRLRALLDEAVLHRTAGDADVMRAQLAHLAGAASLEGTDIQVRVLPFTARAPRHVPGFSYLEYAQVSSVEPAAQVVTDELEGPRIPQLSEKQTWQRHGMFGRMWEAADEAGPAVKRALDSTWA